MHLFLLFLFSHSALQLFFTTFVNRDNAYHALFRIWQNALLGHVSCFSFWFFLQIPLLQGKYSKKYFIIFVYVFNVDGDLFKFHTEYHWPITTSHLWCSHIVIILPCSDLSIFKKQLLRENFWKAVLKLIFG